MLFLLILIMQKEFDIKTIESEFRMMTQSIDRLIEQYKKMHKLSEEIKSSFVKK